MRVQKITHLFIAGITGGLLATSAAQAQTTLVIDDFSTGFGGIAGNALGVDGDTVFFDEMTDIMPSGSIGDRHEWLRGFDFHFPGVPSNHLSITGNDGGPLDEMLNFGGFDYNLEFGLDYTPGQGSSAFDLTAGGGNAFSMDVFFSDIPSAPMTVEVVTGTGTGSMSVDVFLDNLDFTPTTYLFDFDSFSGNLDFSDVQSISWSFLTVDEFGPDAVFDNFNVVATPTPGTAALLSLAGLAATRRRRSL